MAMFSATTIKAHQSNTKIAKRCKIMHHVRTNPIDAQIKSVSDLDIKPSIGCGEDEYSCRCQNLLNNCPEDFLAYMWNINSNKYFDTRFKTDLSHSNFFVSHNNNEATIIFTSLTNERQNSFVKIANEWSERNKLNLFFIAINGDEMKTKNAEKIANFEIDERENKHVVFVTANMASRSFSVPKIVNGIMMVNEPGLASAVQKYNRLSTCDYNLETKNYKDKTAHMYWFNFSSIKSVCPLYTLLYNDLLENKKRKDTNGNSLVNMFDCVNIFEQVEQKMKEKTRKWDENEIFSAISSGTVSHDEVTAHIVNFCPELEEAIAKMIKEFRIDLSGLNVANWKIGKTLQKKIETGRSKPTAKKEPTEKEKKIQILNLEVATSLVGMTLAHEERNFNAFVTDACHIFSTNVVKIIGKAYLENLWSNCFEKTITDLKFKC